MGGVVIGLGGFAEEIGAASMLSLKIFDTPWRPERFEVSFGEGIIHAKFLMV